MIGNIWLWIGFNFFVLCMLLLDLGVFHRKQHAMKMQEALAWTGVWIFLAMVFNATIWYFFGEKKAIEFLSGYVLEKSLSVDNIFVFSLIFSYFSVPLQYQHKVLFWGIFSALIMRVTFIFAGLKLIEHFHWVFYLFGAFLIYTGIKMLVNAEKKLQPDKNPLLKFIKRFFPVSDEFHEDKFLVKINGKTVITRLLLVLMLIEITDLIFAVDSIPAVLAVSNDAFIVYTSNAFAILGLRSLYFVLAGMNDYFRYLKYGLSAVLIFVGIKMCLADVFKIPMEISLIIIVAILFLSIVFSRTKKIENKKN